MEFNGGYRLPSYKGIITQQGSISHSFQVTPTQMTLQKQARLRQNLKGKSPNELSIKLEKQSNVTTPNEDEPHLAVYDKIPKGMNPKEYKQWAQQWLPRLTSGKGKKKAKGFALHKPSLITMNGDERSKSTETYGPLVLHFNHGNKREESTEYLDLYTPYKTRRSQSAKLPKTKRHSGSPRKLQSNDPKWDFLRTEEEPKTVKGTKLEIPAWQTSRNTPDPNELNQFLDSMKERTYMSFCQRSAEQEKNTSPRSIKSKSAEVKLERLNVKRNKLGILEPPQRVPTRRGNLRQGHSFEINMQRMNEFELINSPNLEEAIVHIKKSDDYEDQPIFLTEGNEDEVEEKRSTKIRCKDPVPPYITRIPSNLAKEEVDEPEEDTTSEKVDSVSNFVISGSKFGLTNNLHEGGLLKNTNEHCANLEKSDTDNADAKSRLNYNESIEPLQPTLNGHIDVTLPNSANSGAGNQPESPEDADNQSKLSGDDYDNDTNRFSKSREVVIKFSKDDRNKIESIRTVTSERLVIRD